MGSMIIFVDREKETDVVKKILRVDSEMSTIPYYFESLRFVFAAEGRDPLT